MANQKGGWDESFRGIDGLKPDIKEGENCPGKGGRGELDSMGCW